MSTPAATQSTAPPARANREELLALVRELVGSRKPSDVTCSCRACDVTRKAVRVLAREDAS
jgi:hypothetical protein